VSHPVLTFFGAFARPCQTFVFAGQGSDFMDLLTLTPDFRVTFFQL
jgi:hypothetical protein